MVLPRARRRRLPNGVERLLHLRVPDDPHLVVVAPHRHGVQSGGDLLADETSGVAETMVIGLHGLHVESGPEELVMSGRAVVSNLIAVVLAGATTRVVPSVRAAACVANVLAGVVL